MWVRGGAMSEEAMGEAKEKESSRRIRGVEVVRKARTIGESAGRK
jgi:hypothetical protein